MTYCLFLSDSGCVNKFVHSSNCVNELNIIKLTTCHEFLLAELRRLKKKNSLWENNKCTVELPPSPFISMERRLKQGILKLTF